MPSYSKIVPIVDLTPQSDGTGKKRLSKFYKENLADVLESVKEYPTIVVSVTGLFRSGKSFLINLMITFLRHLQKHGTSDGWTTSNVPIQGVQWAQQKETVTKGILMWQEPFILTRENGRKVAVVLIDCQGTGDAELSNTKLDTLIFYISLQLSTVQIINLKTQMSANDLNTLVMCTDYADATADGEEDEDDTLFNRLIYVQRNWESDYEYGERPDSEFKKLVRGTNTSEEIKTAGEGILKAFRKVSTYAIPHPGKKLARSSEGDTICVSEKYVDEEFLDAVCTLFKNMFCNPEMDKEVAKGKAIIDDFKILERRIAENDVETKSPKDSLDDSRAYKAFKTVSPKSEESYELLDKEARQGSKEKEVLVRELDQIFQSTVGGYDKVYRRKPDSVKTKGYSKYFDMLHGKFSDKKVLIIEQAAIAVANKEAALARAALEAEKQRLEEQGIKDAKLIAEMQEKERLQDEKEAKLVERQRLLDEKKKEEKVPWWKSVLKVAGTVLGGAAGGMVGGPAGALAASSVVGSTLSEL